MKNSNFIEKKFKILLNLNEHHVETMASREISKSNDLICLHKVGVSLPGDRCEQLIDTTTDAAGGRVESERWTITSDWPCLHFHFHSIEFSPPKKTLTRFNGQADTSVRHLSATHSTDKWQVSSVSSSAFHCGGASFHYFAISFVLTSDDVSDLNVKKNVKKWELRLTISWWPLLWPPGSKFSVNCPSGERVPDTAVWFSSN